MPSTASSWMFMCAILLVPGPATPQSKDEELLGYALEGEAEEVERLLAEGADPNAVDDGGETALMFGASSGNPDVVRLLLEAGADPDARNEYGETALMNVVMTDGEVDEDELHPVYAAIVRLLLEGEADPRLTDEDGRTALDIARNYGLEHMVALLE